MHPNDMCKHLTAAILCTVPGCQEERAAELLAKHPETKLKAELAAAYANLTATQERCTELIQENRDLKRERAAMRSRWAQLLEPSPVQVTAEGDVHITAQCHDIPSLSDIADPLKPMFPSARKEAP